MILAQLFLILISISIPYTDFFCYQSTLCIYTSIYVILCLFVITMIYPSFFAHNVMNYCCCLSQVGKVDENSKANKEKHKTHYWIQLSLENIEVSISVISQNIFQCQ